MNRNDIEKIIRDAGYTPRFQTMRSNGEEIIEVQIWRSARRRVLGRLGEVGELTETELKQCIDVAWKK